MWQCRTINREGRLKSHIETKKGGAVFVNGNQVK